MQNLAFFYTANKDNILKDTARTNASQIYSNQKAAEAASFEDELKMFMWDNDSCHSVIYLRTERQGDVCVQ